MIMIYVCLLKIYLESYSPMTSYRTLMNLALRFRAMIHLKVNVVQNVRWGSVISFLLPRCLVNY